MITLLLFFQLVAPPGLLTATVDALPVQELECPAGQQPYWVTPLVYICFKPPLCPAPQVSVEQYAAPGVRLDTPRCVSP
jgi:hypothetical protein